MVKLILLIALIPLVFGAPTSKVTPALRKALNEQHLVNVFVSLNGGTTEPLAKLARNTYSSRSERLNTVANTLKSHAASSQKELLAYLAKAAPFVKYESFWISNQIYVRGADNSLVESLAKFEQVAEIDLEMHVQLDEPIKPEQEVRAEWGIENVNAPEVWALGIDGENVIISTIDTGARGTHEALRGNYVGASEYGWFDPSGRTASPNDGNGHGTHTTGTIAGIPQIGVAPGSKWMACKGCATNSCSQADLIACGQFIACPHDTNGNNANCAKAPHICSNSWGGGSVPYDAVVNAWHAAGITPVFSLGNSGSSCQTALAPGNRADVIGVGATDINNALASFSSRGPAAGGLIKPEIAAPGVAVRSSYHTSDSAYSALSGTSMACPHVSGVIALMKSYKPDLTFEQIKSYLYAGASLDYQQTGQNCGGISEGRVPNNAFGNGIANALNSVRLLIRDFPRLS